MSPAPDGPPSAYHPADPLPPARDPVGLYRVCLVCLGNICRSPMAEVVLRARLAEAGLAGRVSVDSAGTGAWHVGEQMSPRARVQLARRGYDGEAHRARQFGVSWLPDRDLLLAMDSANFKNLRSLSLTHPAEARRIRLFGDVAGLGGADVPDPYGGDQDEYARVLDMLESATPFLVAGLAAALGASDTGPGQGGGKPAAPAGRTGRRDRGTHAKSERP